MMRRFAIFSAVAVLFAGCGAFTMSLSDQIVLPQAPTPTAQPMEPTIEPSAEETPPIEAFPVLNTPIAPIDQTIATPEPFEPSAVADSALQPYAFSLRRSFVRELDRFSNATRYDLDLTIDPIKRRVIGKQIVRYVNRGESPLNEIALRLFPNTAYMGGAMNVGRVAVDDQVVMPKIFAARPKDRSVLIVPLPQTLMMGQATVLTIEYEIVAPKNPLNGYRTFGEIDGILALPNAYALIPPRDTNGFWRLDVAPTFGDVVFAETALFLARITVPRDVVVVASAVCDEPNASAEVVLPVKTMTCVAAPARDFALHISRAYQVRRVRAPSMYGGSIVVSSFFTPPETRSASNALIFAADAVKTFEKHFGAYPYRELKIFQATTGVGGIEYPISVGITSFSKLRDNDYFEWLVAHEVAHQWWYGMVGSDPVNEAWLDEGLAQYSTSLYIEARHGVAAADRLRERFFTQRWALEKRERGGTKAGKPTMSFNRWAYAPTIYGKSPLFFDQARREGGDALFFAWLKRYFENHRYDIARGENLLAAADQVGNGETARRAHAQWILEDR